MIRIGLSRCTMLKVLSAASTLFGEQECKVRESYDDVANVLAGYHNSFCKTHREHASGLESDDELTSSEKLRSAQQLGPFTL